MGLDAFVPCRCFRNGLTTQSPVDTTLIGDDNGILFLKEPKGKPPKHWKAIKSSFYDWLPNCCDHLHQEYFSARIGSWQSMQFFTKCLEQNSIKQYPALYASLPQAQCDLIPTENTQRVLDELNLFSQESLEYLSWTLVNEKDGKEFCHTTPHSSTILYKNGYSISFDQNGITVRKRNEFLFTSRKITQHTTYGVPTLTAAEGHQVFGTSIGSGSAVWVVQQRQLIGKDLHCVQQLRRTLQAALRIQMPIHMCY